MLLPKRVKHRKQHRGRMTGNFGTWYLSRNLSISSMFSSFVEYSFCRRI